MGLNSLRRKVLLIEDEPSTRNILYVLLAALGCDSDVAHDAIQALSKIRENRFDAVLLDLRCVPNAQIISAITELRPSLAGHIMVITGEISDPEILQTLERCAVPHLLPSRVISDLRGRLRDLISPPV